VAILPPTLVSGIIEPLHKDSSEKATQLLTVEIKSVEQAIQLGNPDARIVFGQFSDERLEKYADSYQGLTSGDNNRFFNFFWEIAVISEEWSLLQGAASAAGKNDGHEQILLWENGSGALVDVLGQGVKGRPIWGRNGVTVRQIRPYPSTIYVGSPYEMSCAVIVPKNEKHLAAIYNFCASEAFSSAIGEIDQKLNVTNATLVKVPFDLDYWTKVAEEKHPHGLPSSYTEDPTQWIFHGHPCGSVVWDEKHKWVAEGPLRNGDTVLQIAVARLLGYRWPAEMDTDMELADEQREWVKRCEALLPFADDDGIVCIPPVRGEASAADRLLNLLASAYGDAWSNDVLAELLKSAGHAGKTLETWLRDKFFTQHCKLFQSRPFIWQIWDGLPDGFSVLVNYHKLDRKNLETLIYTYLGDWIGRQKQDKNNGIDGAEERLAAAEALKKKLEQILEGEAPYDIFVRWKPIEQQPIGWEPDLNDGVRLNIRPFMTVADVKKKDAGILRDKPNIKWSKDRGKDVESAPWFHTFGGERINDHHLTLADKRAAREQSNEGKGV